MIFTLIRLQALPQNEMAEEFTYATMPISTAPEAVDSEFMLACERLGDDYNIAFQYFSPSEDAWYSQAEYNEVMEALK